MTLRISADEYRHRLQATATALTEAGKDAVLVTPGKDLTYLTGYKAVALERLTCLIVLADGDPCIVVPELEALAAKASPIGELGLDIHGWSETESPHTLVAKQLHNPKKVTVDAHMWASHVFGLQQAMPLARMSADTVIAQLRAIKTEQEIAALQAAGKAIDWVHERVPQVLKVGMTEREVAARIAELILEAGHATVDFTVVGSGPNGASPHHEVSDRVIQAGDPVVVDIGGTMPSGYCSDSTRTYAMGEVTAEFRANYEALQAAQAAAREHTRAGVSCESVDAAARDVLTEAGLGDTFVHRTGHGIGMDTHEDPYIVSGNKAILVPGNAFSIEPGFYLPGRFGARIEDIVIATETGHINCNNQSRELVVIPV